ncbi:hypothetical protein GCM10022252_69200 [Streptosporangium oxazolinicum]|uniref:Histidine kinase/HSP90-like ATPase domain-containing protein n=1 Tax=Streptosporangium oxazolinicum TaxID=909287 RepID=A0ABP8BHP1_9ACTN
MRATPFQVSLIGEIELPCEHESPGTARTVVNEWLGKNHPASFNVRLVVSELVTNSVRYASLYTSKGIGLRLYDVGEAVRVEVQDSGAKHAYPKLDAPQSDIENSVREGGRGLFIVEKYSVLWGVTFIQNPLGCIVWAEVPLQEPTPEEFDSTVRA